MFRGSIGSGGKEDEMALGGSGVQSGDPSCTLVAVCGMLRVTGHEQVLTGARESLPCFALGDLQEGLASTKA